MINYTTPTISLTVEGVDLSGMDVYVSLEQGQKELTKTGEDLIIEPIIGEETTDTSIVFTLTQEESASFDFGKSVSVSLTANQKIRVYGRNSRGSSYYIYAPTLVIVEQ